MSLYIGKDNHNRPLLHATRNPHGDSEMKGGVLNDTVFHSSLPYLKVLGTTSVGGRVQKYYGGHDQWNFSTQVFAWDIPHDIKVKVNSGRIFLVHGVDSNGVRWNVNIYSIFSRSLTQGKMNGDSRYFTNYMQLGGNAPTSGFAFSNKGKHDGTSWLYMTGGFFTRASRGTLTGTAHPSQNPSLNPTSNSILYYRALTPGGYNNSWLTPDIVTIEFTELGVSVRDNGSMVVDSIVPAGRDIYIDNRHMLIGNVNYLGNLQYLAYSKKVYPARGEYVPADSFLTPPTWSTYTLGHNIPIGAAPYASSIKNIFWVSSRWCSQSTTSGGVVMVGRRGSNTTANAGGTLFQGKMDFPGGRDAYNRATNIINNDKNNARCGVFEKVVIPSTPGLELTQDTLKIGGKVMFSPSVVPLALVRDTKHIVMPETSVSVGTNADRVVDIGYIDTTSASKTLGLVTVANVASSNMGVSYTHRPDIWAAQEITQANWGQYANRNASLIALENGEYLPIGCVSGEWYAYESQSKLTSVAVYYLYKTGARIYLRIVLSTTGGSVRGEFRFKYPRINIAITELTTG